MRLDLTVRTTDPDLDERLSAELDAVNAAATADVAPSEELTASVRDADGELVGGISGWTWGVAAGIALMWVRPDQQGTGTGTALVEAFETEARRRGCTHVFTTSFTFQAPGFYEKQGYREIFRWDDLPRVGEADVHLRKNL